MIKIKFVDGLFGKLLENTENAIKDSIEKVLIAFLRGLGEIGIYISIALIITGIFCLIFNYKKILKIGLMSFLISIIISILGGNL